MNARQVRVLPECGTSLIAARPRARILLASDPAEANELRVAGQSLKHVKEAQSE